MSQRRATPFREWHETRDPPRPTGILQGQNRFVTRRYAGRGEVREDQEEATAVETAMREADRQEKGPGRQPGGFGLLEGLQIAFLVAACFGGFSFLRGPAVNDAQLIFRVGLSVVGLIGFVVITAIKLVRRKP
jgi:hypothetical protein